MKLIMNVQQTVTGWVEQAIDAFQLGEFVLEQILFGVALQAFPDPARETEQAWIPQIVVYLEMAGPTPGTSVFGTPMFRPYSLTQQVVAEFVTDALRDMVAKRAEAQEASEQKAGESPQQPKPSLLEGDSPA